MSVDDPSLQSSQSRTSFFDLSRELRDYCNDLALTSQDPLIDSQYDLETASQFKTASSDQRNVATNLLQCHSIIAHEVASIFYGKNKFVFAHDWTWEMVATWFINIGPKNSILVTRSCCGNINLLTHGRQRMEIESRSASLTGRLWNSLFHEIFTCISRKTLHLRVRLTNINPAIETFFKLLGKERHSKLLLIFSLQRAFIPGLVINTDINEHISRWISMDIPNVVEKLRTLYTADSVDVIWKGELLGDWFFDKRETIESCWKILVLEGYDRVIPGREQTYPWIRFTLRSKELPDVLLADKPSPYSGMGRYIIQDASSPDQQVLVRF